jgi:signal transduction histidine kinase
MITQRHSLRGRIVLIIVGSVAATSLIFGLAVFAIAYAMEDSLFEETLGQEIAAQKSTWQQTGALAQPANGNVTIYLPDQALPPEISSELEESPKQTEFFGRDGRHYHIRRFDLNDGRPDTLPLPAVAVFEVSDDLLVRPYRESIIVMLVAMSLIVAVIMAMVGWWLVNLAMRPLGDLATRVAMSETAIPVLEARDFPSNEIGTLAEALEQSFGRVSAFIERERAFTRDASHELRTPLSVIRGAAEVMRLNQDLSPQLSEPLRRIETATTDMTLALDQLLSLARESNGIRKERVLLRPLVEKAISWARIRYPASHIVVDMSIEGDPEVMTYPVSLQLVLNNLVGNCFQHVGKGWLMIGFEGGCLLISDDGPGLGPGTTTIAPFQKGVSSSGSGLGLDICQRLCEAMGIDLDVSSGKGEYRGTHVRLALPRI